MMTVDVFVDDADDDAFARDALLPSAGDADAAAIRIPLPLASEGRIVEDVGRRNGEGGRSRGSEGEECKQRKFLLHRRLLSAQKPARGKKKKKSVPAFSAGTLFFRAEKFRRGDGPAGEAAQPRVEPGAVLISTMSCGADSRCPAAETRMKRARSRSVFRSGAPR